MKKRKNEMWLYLLIGMSFIPMIVFPAKFLMTGIVFQLSDFLWATGAWMGLFGFTLLFWQYVLGVKSIVYFFSEDISFTTTLHKYLGIYGFLLILLHPAILIYDFLFNRGIDLIFPHISPGYNLSVIYGEAAFLLVILIWVTSYLSRKKFTFRWWKRIHLLGYLILPLVYLHANSIGTYFASKPLTYYFEFLTVVFILILIYRILLQLGIFKYKYKVVNVNMKTHDVVKIDMVPLGRFMQPKPSQFIEFQIGWKGESHPFTVSEYIKDNHQLAISPKASGKFSAGLSSLKPGQVVFLTGPYGIFMREAYKDTTKKIVILAGGIGITPFISVIDYIGKTNKFEEAYLFYGNKTVDDIAFKEELDSVAQKTNLKVIHILSNDNNAHPEYEQGFLTVNLMKKYLKSDIKEFDFFVCGPPIMLTKAKADLANNGVNEDRIFFEEFSW